MQDIKTQWNRFANSRSGQADYFILTSSHYSLTQRLLPLIEQYASGKILDLGTGFGAYRPVLEPRGDLYVGVDIQLHNLSLDVLADGCRLPFAVNEFDTVFCSQVLEHTPEPWQLLQEAYRILCPGGILILSAPHLSYVHAAPTDFYRYTSYGLTFLLRQARFEQVWIQPAGGIFSLLGGMFQSLYLAVLPERPASLVSMALWVNRFLSRLFVAVDSLVDRSELLALNFVALARKQK